MSDEILLTIGKKLKKHRMLRGLTQKELSEVLQLDTMHYSRIERCERQISLTKLIEACRFFNITLDELIELPKTEDDADEKKNRYESIRKKVKPLSGKQLMIIESIIDSVIPYI